MHAYKYFYKNDPYFSLKKKYKYPSAHTEIAGLTYIIKHTFGIFKNWKMEKIVFFAKYIFFLTLYLLALVLIYIVVPTV